MNKPIGVPSGWEEIAAACSYMKWDQSDMLRYLENSDTSSLFYVECYHDWTIFYQQSSLTQHGKSRTFYIMASMLN